MGKTPEEEYWDQYIQEMTDWTDGFGVLIVALIPFIALVISLLFLS